MRGMIKHSRPERGFAFLTSDESDETVFVHIKDCPGAKLFEGVWYEYDVKTNPRNGKPQAYNLRRLTQQEVEQELAWASRNPKPVQYGY